MRVLAICAIALSTIALLGLRCDSHARHGPHTYNGDRAFMSIVDHGVQEFGTTVVDVDAPGLLVTGSDGGRRIHITTRDEQLQRAGMIAACLASSDYDSSARHFPLTDPALYGWNVNDPPEGAEAWLQSVAFPSPDEWHRICDPILADHRYSVKGQLWNYIGHCAGFDLKVYVPGLMVTCDEATNTVTVDGWPEIKDGMVDSACAYEFAKVQEESWRDFTPAFFEWCERFCSVDPDLGDWSLCF